MNWTKEQEAEANKQGWGLCTIWDAAKQRVECEVVAKTAAFLNDETARTFVMIQTGQNNKLCIAATQAVFHSRLGATESTRKGKTK